MHMVNGEKRARYRLYTQVYEASGVTPAGVSFVEEIDVDITVPRFIIEEFHEPWEEAFNPADEGTRGNGYYTHLWTVAHHDENCCDGREVTQQGELCLGLYREPNDRDLNELRRRIRERDAERRYRAVGEQMTDDEVADASRELRTQIESMEARRKADYYQTLLDSFKTHGHRLFTDDPSVLSHGKYHFINNKPLGVKNADTDSRDAA